MNEINFSKPYNGNSIGYNLPIAKIPEASFKIDDALCGNGTINYKMELSKNGIKICQSSHKNRK